MPDAVRVHGHVRQYRDRTLAINRDAAPSIPRRTVCESAPWPEWEPERNTSSGPGTPSSNMIMKWQNDSIPCSRQQGGVGWWSCVGHHGFVLDD